MQQSSGAVDNASGVVALLELANVSTAQDICLAFPVACCVAVLNPYPFAFLPLVLSFLTRLAAVVMTGTTPIVDVATASRTVFLIPLRFVHSRNGF